MQLTKHFKLREFAVSADHPELAAKIEFSEAEEIKAYLLCATILQPIRYRYGTVKILSGKRSSELNEAVGGAVYSDHLFEFVSAATDFTLSRASVKNCFEWIQNMLPFAFGQLIYYPDSHFVHVSLPIPKHYGEVFKL